MLTVGSTGAAVSTLQKMVGGLKVDGSYGPATVTRVKQYQAAKGLPVTGVTDLGVWYALLGVITPATATAPAPTPTPTPTPPATTDPDSDACPDGARPDRPARPRSRATPGSP